MAQSGCQLQRAGAGPRPGAGGGEGGKNVSKLFLLIFHNLDPQVQTKLGLKLSPALILAYVKSAKGRLGKTAGCFNILAKQKEETFQGSNQSPDSVVEEVLPPALKENNTPRVHKPAKKVGDWKRNNGKRLERVMK